MPDSNNSSFIPKAGPVGHRRSSATKQVYIFTLISYILIFATLIASGGTFLLKKNKEKLLNEAHVKLYQDISIFDDAKFQEVINFDRHLKQAKNRIDNSVSVVAIFDALEASTIDTVKIESLSLERELDDKIILSATINTDSFDSTLFQRQVYGTNDVVEAPVITGFDTSGIDSLSTENSTDNDEKVDTGAKVTFETTLEVPLLSIPYTGTDLSVNTSFVPTQTPTPDIQTDPPITSDINPENI